jgi:beta-glucosidase
MAILDTVEMLEAKHMSHFNLIGPITDPKLVAMWHNTIQQHVLAHTRLGIPVTLSSDPRHHFNYNVGTGFKAGALSQWPETWGFGALRDPDLARVFGDCVRREYIAVGLRVALHPQADLATEYRWARVQSTFSEDAKLAARLVAAYIEGMQGRLLQPGLRGQNGRFSVSTMTKHFPGAGPQKDGEDPHFTYGREQVYPGDNFDYHLEPFREALKAGTRQIMVRLCNPCHRKRDQCDRAMLTDLLAGLWNASGVEL